jgi:hypothetical protein
LRLVVTGARRFSQAISEGDGISLVAVVADLDAARAAEAEGAEALVLRTAVDGIAETTGLPLLWRPPGSPEHARAAGADACVVAVGDADDDGDELERLHRDALDLGLDCVIEVHDEEELELALERIDPEIFLLSVPQRNDGQPPLESTLDLLPDVPAGKLAVAEVDVTYRDEVAELERAGVDAVIVRAGSVADLIGEPPPEV